MCSDLLFLFVLVWIQAIVGREVPDLTFVIRNTSNKIEPICIADKNVIESAIAWSYPISHIKDTLPLIVSKYVPEIQNDYSCNFLKTAHCNSVWSMEDWQFSRFDSHRFKPILDARWEDFPTLLTSSFVKEFKNRIDIPHTFELGISIRAEKYAEIFLCTGWDPYTYPCYYISIGGNDNDKQQAFLRKYKNIPHKMRINDTKLDIYMCDDQILSEYEWRNFIISLSDNGTITLVETLKNISLLTYKDPTALQPIYLFIRSKDTKALWKIHNNHYIFTNVSKMTQLGPAFTIYGNNLCVSLFVSMCRYCRMSFYIMIKGEKQIIKTVFNENDDDEFLWKKIKLLQHDILEDKIKLFVETKYVNNTFVSKGFWGIDDVRMCFEEEIKVSHLVTTTQWDEDNLSHVSCQVLSFPTWRPIQYTFLSHKNEIEYTATTTTIQVSKKPQSDDDHNTQVQQYYIIQYEGKDTCLGKSIKSRSRLKSQGFVLARAGNAVIQELVPYTVYNITFSNVIDDIQIQREVNTLPTEKLKNSELPKNVSMQVTDSTCEIFWEAPSCNESFGPIMYQVKVYVKNGTLSITQADIKTHYAFENLEPNLNYEVEITTGRRLENLNDSNLSVVSNYNFTTSKTVVTMVENLEVYSTTRNSAHLRFDMSTNMQQKPNATYLRWCHPLLYGKCKSDVRELSKCKLWDDKYCININNLSTGFTYTFFVSFKNSNGEANATSVVVERSPGTPSNVTYKMRNCVKIMDCCNLNISWIHPKNQNGSITMFDIFLSESSYTYVLDSYKNIHEVLKLADKGYQSVYNYNIKYISCSVPYKISVRAVNDYFKGQFVSTPIAFDNKVNYVDPMPKYVNSTNETVTFEIPPIEIGSEDSILMVVVQDYNKNKTKISEEINNLELFDDVNELCNQFGETWIAKVVQVNGTFPLSLIIGDGTSSYVPKLNRSIVNSRLTPDTEYCFTFTFTKNINDSERVIVYHDKNLFTEGNHFAPLFQDGQVSKTVNVATYLLPVLFITLLVACGTWLSYRYFKKKRHSSNSDHVYEAMPFDDYFTDAISNDTYDRLSHE